MDDPLKMASSDGDNSPIYAIRDNVITEEGKERDNTICADCDAKDPEWASINLGIFICIKCAGIHRNLGVHISKVRSLTLDHCWDDKVNGFMAENGNLKVRKIYESHVPCYYLRPSSTELSPFVRTNWIDQKYTKQAFKEKSTVPMIKLMPEQSKSDVLFKQNMKNVWQKRYFILHKKHLYYYKDEFDSYPKGSIDITQCNLTIPEDANSSGKKFVFELEQKKLERTYPIACENMEDMFDWVHAIKRATIFYTIVVGGEESSTGTEEKKDESFPCYSKMEPIKEGELNKQGGKVKNWHKRWCVLTSKAIYYFKSVGKPKNESVPEGEISLIESDYKECKSSKKKHLFSLVGDGRVYYLTASNETELKDWTDKIENIIEERIKELGVEVNFEDPEGKLVPKTSD